MYSTELTPIIRKKPTRTYCTRLLPKSIVIILAVIFIIGAISYITSPTSSAAAVVSFSQRQTDTNNDAVSVSERKNQVSIILEPDEIYHLEVLNVYKTKDEWIDYHSEIIQKQGYDPTDKSVRYVFTMHDYNFDKEYYYAKYGFTDYDDEDGEEHHGEDETTREPTKKEKRAAEREKKDFSQSTDKIENGGLKCYFRYALNEFLNDIDNPLTCSEETDVLVGCVGGSTNRPKDLRSGEKAIDNGCVVDAESIYIRCCHPSNKYEHITMTGKVSHVDHHTHHHDDTFPTYETDDFCQSTDLAGFADEFNNDNYYMVGCTGWMGSLHEEFDKTESEYVIGTKIETTETGETMCKSHRGDKGFVAAAAIVVNLKGGELECVTVDAPYSRIPKKYSAKYISANQGKLPIHGAMLFCPDGYNLMDCSGFTSDLMDECGHSSEGLDKVSATVFHGGDLKCMAFAGPHCSANGYTDKIRVQARCCRIEDTGHHIDTLN